MLRIRREGHAICRLIRLSFLERLRFFGKDGVMPAPRKYPPELRDHAARLVFETSEEFGEVAVR
jgi:hypothetical protein